MTFSESQSGRAEDPGPRLQVESFSHDPALSLQSSPHSRRGWGLGLRSSASTTLSCPGSHCYSPSHCTSRILGSSTKGLRDERSITHWYSPKSCLWSSVTVTLTTAMVGSSSRKYLPTRATFLSVFLVFVRTSVSAEPWLPTRCQALKLDS